MISGIRIFALLLAAAVLFPMRVDAENGKEMTELLGIKLGRAMTLYDVQKRLGNTRVIETGEAGEYRATVCYYLPSCKVKVEFWSDELGGYEHRVIGFTLTRVTTSKQACLKPATVNCSALRLANGIHLGIRLDDYKRILGDGTELVEGYYQKGFESQKPMTERERRSMSKGKPEPLSAGLIWDINVFVRGAFGTEGLDILEVSRTETY